MRLVEVLMTIPSIYLLVALAAVLPPGLTVQRFVLIVLITSFIAWAGLARVIRDKCCQLKNENLSKQQEQWAASHFTCPAPRFAADS